MMSASPQRRKVALVVTGGTITALADDRFEILDYGQAGALSAADILAKAPELAQATDILPVDFGAMPSFEISVPEWRRMMGLFRDLLASHPDLDGIVMTHGTGSLEETAFLLSLVWDLPVPLVITGAQRPASALGADGWMNLAQALLVAQDAQVREFGVVVVFNGEVHLAADVVKTSNLGVGTFQSPELGPVGLITGLTPSFHRLPAPSRSLLGRFPGALVNELPRVDILFCHSGGDAVAIEAFIGAGAQGVVLAGFAPGYATSAQAKRLERWVLSEGGTVIYSSRAAGYTTRNSRNGGHGFYPSGRLPPAKARLLLQLGLNAGLKGEALAALFTESR